MRLPFLIGLHIDVIGRSVGLLPIRPQLCSLICWFHGRRVPSAVDRCPLLEFCNQAMSMLLVVWGCIERVAGQCAEFDSRLLPHSHHTQRPHSVDEILSRFRPQTHEGHTFSVGSLRAVRAHVSPSGRLIVRCTMRVYTALSPYAKVFTLASRSRILPSPRSRVLFFSLMIRGVMVNRVCEAFVAVNK